MTEKEISIIRSSLEKIERERNIFGGFEIMEHVGEGGGGTVFKVRYKPNGMVKALKAVRIEVPEWDSSFDGVLERTKKEALTLKELYGCREIIRYDNHEVITVKNEEYSFNYLLILMEYVEKNLYSEMRERTMTRRGELFSDNEVVRLGLDICSALIYCHGKGIIHRDIKPSNIFIMPDGSYKLGDFGISRELKTTMTVGIGTVGYIAPEALKTGHYDCRTDIYSLGMTMYNMLRGEVYLSGSEKSVGRKALGEIVSKAIQYLPEDRFVSAEDMYDDIEYASVIIKRGASLDAAYIPEPQTKRETSVEIKTKAVLHTDGDENGTLAAFAEEKKKTAQSKAGDDGRTKTAEVPESKADFEYDVKNRAAIIKKYRGQAESVTVPKQLDSYPVVEIDVEAFAFSKIKGINIPAGVTFICAGAFSECAKLKNIFVNEANIYYYDVGGVLFSKAGELVIYPRGRNSAEYVVPSGVTEIGMEAFSNCKGLKKVVLPDSLKEIEAFAFDGAGLEYIDIPAKVEKIEDLAFAECDNLKEARIPQGIKVDELTFSYTTGLMEYSVENGEAIVKEYRVQTKSVTIPWKICGYQVTLIAKNAFENCTSLSEVTILAKDVKIDNTAFSGCRVKRVRCSTQANISRWRLRKIFGKETVIEYIKRY